MEYFARYICGDAIKMVGGMCNLYSYTKGPAAIRELLKILRQYDLTGNMEPLTGIYPNRMAPIVRLGPEGQLQLEMARWGMPAPQIPNRKPRNPYLTNIRNTDSRYWQRWLKDPAHRCLVPFSSFSEPDNRGLEEPGNPNPRSIWTWFAFDETRPLAFFPGIWHEYEADRGTKAQPNVGRHLVYAFLTSDASVDVAPIHPDATPVILFNEIEREQWMSAPWEIARDLQKPPPAGALRIVARDTKQDA